MNNTDSTSIRTEFEESPPQPQDVGAPRVRPVEERIAVALLCALVLITAVNVVVRYLTDRSFAWTEEISVFLLVLLTLTGASSAAASDSNIRIEYFYAGGTNRRRLMLKLISAVTCCVMFLILTLFSGLASWNEIVLSETTVGLGVPSWWYSIWVPPLALVAAFRSARLGLQTLRRGMTEVEVEEAVS